MLVHRGAIRRREVAVDVRGDERVERAAIKH
jgi:hypothetical protein